jgi:hypothetical protein
MLSLGIARLVDHPQQGLADKLFASPLRPRNLFAPGRLVTSTVVGQRLALARFIAGAGSLGSAGPLKIVRAGLSAPRGEHHSPT